MGRGKYISNCPEPIRNPPPERERQRDKKPRDTRPPERKRALLRVGDSRSGAYSSAHPDSVALNHVTFPLKPGERFDLRLSACTPPFRKRQAWLVAVPRLFFLQSKQTTQRAVCLLSVGVGCWSNNIPTTKQRHHFCLSLSGTNVNAVKSQLRKRKTGGVYLIFRGGALGRETERERDKKKELAAVLVGLL